MFLLKILKSNYTVLESLHWFQVLSYNGPRSVNFGGISKVIFFHPVVSWDSYILG